MDDIEWMLRAGEIGTVFHSTTLGVGGYGEVHKVVYAASQVNSLAYSEYWGGEHLVGVKFS